jgi:hypothetical protein
MTLWIFKIEAINIATRVATEIRWLQWRCFRQTTGMEIAANKGRRNMIAGS